MVGFLGLPAWLGPNVFEHFLEPVFETRYQAAEEIPHYPHSTEILLTAVSVALAAMGIYLAYHFFLQHKEKPALWLEKFRGVHQLVSNKYYVDETYDLLFVDRAKDSGRLLSAFDKNVVDGAVNGTATITRITAWISSQADIHIVDRIVNLVAQFFNFFSSVVRKLQNGLVQQYALFFVIGIILAISLYLYLGV